MRYNEIDLLPDGCLRLRMIPPFFSDILGQLPAILDGEIPIEGAPDLMDPERELFPSIYADTEGPANEDWRKYARPDLVALFASRKEIIEQDLESMVEDFYLVPYFEESQRLVADPEDDDFDPWNDFSDDDDEGSDPDHAQGGLAGDVPCLEQPDEDDEIDDDENAADETGDDENTDDDMGDDEEDGGGAEEFVEIFGQLARPIMPLRRLLIPAANRSAWLSSLNGARLLIARAFGFMDAMPERELHYDPEDPEQLALLLMDALGELEHLLVEVDQELGS